MRGTIFHYSPPENDLCKYLKGTWKRNLEWRGFGGNFQHLRSTNNLVIISEDTEAATQPGSCFLEWSFGNTLHEKDLSSTYSVQKYNFVKVSFFGDNQIVQAMITFIPDEEGGMYMEWSFEGVTCHGIYKPESSAVIFNFCLPESLVTITYRLLDDNTMAICILDMDNHNAPTIQYGNMYRIDPSKYMKSSDSGN